MINKSHKGFTLFELMITLALAAILVSLAAPSFFALRANARLDNTALDILAGLNLARQSAISRNLTAFICHSSNADTATPTCDNNAISNWNTGILVYHPPENTLVNAERSYDPNTDVLLKKLNIDSQNDQQLIVTENAAENYITFSGDGALFNDVAIGLTLCDNRPTETGKQILVSRIGRISSSDFDCP